MKLALVILILLGNSGPVFSQEPGLFQAGIYGDVNRTVTCISGQANDAISQVIWAWVPEDRGLAYITLRLDFPDNLDHSARPECHPLVTEVIFTDFPDGTEEWNMILKDCPSGWVLVMTQQCVLLDDQPGQITVLGEHSMMRDCQFVLNDLTVLNNLRLNDPECEFVPAVPKSWGKLKSLYR